MKELFKITLTLAIILVAANMFDATINRNRFLLIKDLDRLFKEHNLYNKPFNIRLDTCVSANKKDTFVDFNINILIRDK